MDTETVQKVSTVRRAAARFFLGAAFLWFLSSIARMLLLGSQDARGTIFGGYLAYELGGFLMTVSSLVLFGVAFWFDPNMMPPDESAVCQSCRYYWGAGLDPTYYPECGARNKGPLNA